GDRAEPQAHAARHRLLAFAGPDRLRGRTAHAPEPPRSSAPRSKRPASLWSRRRERCRRLVTSEYAVNGASCLRCPDVAKVQSIQVNILLPQKASPPFPVRRSSILSGWRPALWKKPAGFPGYEGQTRMGHWDLLREKLEKSNDEINGEYKEEFGLEDTDNIAVEENVDKHLQKDLNMEENQNIIETLRGKVREKLKNA
ncbi:hypothetical protein E2I00_008658, partial [Balaenoptera physalus]